MKHHYVYRIDRSSTGEYYVGVRSSALPVHLDGGYLGSGPRIKDAVRRHGRAQFTKTIIARVVSRKFALEIERELIGPDQACDPLCLNVALGGGGGSRLAGGDHREAWNRRHAAKERERWAARLAEREAEGAALVQPLRNLFESNELPLS